MTGLERLLIQILVAALVVAGTLFGGYRWGHGVAEDACELAKAEAVQKATKEIESDRDAGYELASEFEVERRKFKRLYENSERTRKQSMDTPVVCPASGRLGDLLVPRDAIDGMFNRLPAVPASGPAASEPAGAVRGRPPTSGG